MRLLVVEDDPSFGQALRDGLAADGTVVDLVTDGHTALSRARTTSYDAVVLDLMVPGRHGYDVCRTLRAEGIWTPVLVLTAKDGEYDQADALDLGADAYLVKPTPLVVVQATLRALVRRGDQERPAVLQVGPLLLDPARHQATLAGVELGLRRREFGLLQYLMRRPGKVVSKADLLVNVWEQGLDADPNIVEQYVSLLRRKLPVGCGVELVTVRHVGYKLQSG